LRSPKTERGKEGEEIQKKIKSMQRTAFAAKLARGKRTLQKKNLHHMRKREKTGEKKVLEKKKRGREKLAHDCEQSVEALFPRLLSATGRDSREGRYRGNFSPVEISSGRVKR